MTFAFDFGGTISRYPEQIWTMMETLRLGGHRVVILSAVSRGDGIPEVRNNLKGVPFNFDQFEVVAVIEDYTGVNKANWCRDNMCCLLMDDASYNMTALLSHSPTTARVQVLP